ncbi:ATP-binding cassette domain-containing protein [Hyphobacterium sp. CCMP332]|uniref:ATP-binding cassette domain-containing protein n=1 Tax=Hyphobacterium sp. CCMP332 TaxID=2749086 RepID=UPI00164FE506|nr:ATP-binding cassette domain-containing protein [Hyphobacterium sp. CCMP332]QNL18442.1 ATP-binding cassette domain-containing protein [Hyphobacterium sp. CCMP332]
MSPNASAQDVLRVEGLTKQYSGGVLAADNVGFTAAAGELIAIVGESGSGKTTTLKAINRLIEPSAGTILFQGRDVMSLAAHDLRREIGWVMQGDGLFPHLTAAQNIALTPRLLKWEPARISARIDELLELVRLDPADFRDRLPHQMSGGQRQRIAIARALAVEPPLLLLDEAFSALDPVTRAALQDDFVALQERLQFAAVMVTHDMAEALLLANRILVMKDGRVVQTGTPSDLVNRPGDPYVTELLAAPAKQARAVAALEQAP